MITLDVFTSNIITGFSVGIGSAIANYFITKHFIERVEKLERRMERNKNHE